MSADLPLSDHRSRAPHDADKCALEQCEFLRLLRPRQDAGGWLQGRVRAPSGMQCPDWTCGCEGKA